MKTTTAELLEKEVLTERELKLLLNRANAGEELPHKEDGYELTSGNLKINSNL